MDYLTFISEIQNKNIIKKLEQLTSISPSSAIIESWKKVEIVLKDLLNGEDSSLYISSFQMLSTLKRKGIINTKEYQILNQLRVLRNNSVHMKDNELDIEDAKDYVIVSLKSVDEIVQRSGRVNRYTKKIEK